MVTAAVLSSILGLQLHFGFFLKGSFLEDLTFAFFPVPLITMSAGSPIFTSDN